MRKILAVAEFTIRKIEEPAFLILLAFGLVSGYLVSEMEPFSFAKEYLQMGTFTSQADVAFSLLGGFTVLIGITLVLCAF